MRSLATRLGHHHIRVNAVLPDWGDDALANYDSSVKATFTGDNGDVSVAGLGLECIGFDGSHPAVRCNVFDDFGEFESHHY